jgi:hypothetical protein
MTAKLHILIVKCYLFTKKIIFCTQISIILMAILMKQDTSIAIIINKV